MAQILVKARNNIQNDGMDDKRYQRGHPVVVMPDDHVWGNMERLPDFVVIKIPMIPVERVQKYISSLVENKNMLMKRVWRIRWDDLPAQAKNTLAATGQLTIKASNDYDGAYDYTWDQVKSYFRNELTQTNEAENIGGG